MENMWLTASVMGIVEGLTEFLPVSSTGHLILAGKFLHFTGEKAASFEIFIQLGAIMAVVVMYWKRFKGMVCGLLRPANGGSAMTSLRGTNAVPAGRQGASDAATGGQTGFTIWHLGVAIAPVVVVGFGLYKIIKHYLFSDIVVVYGLVIGGIVMIGIDAMIRRKERAGSAGTAFPVTTLDQVTYKQAFIIGCVQCLSVCPGVSRAAATIIGGILCGLSYQVAAEFSFIVAVPVMAMATGYDMLKSYQLLTGDDVLFFAVGGIVSFVVAYLAIKCFIAIVAQYRLAPFGWYRIIVGALVWWCVR